MIELIISNFPSPEVEQDFYKSYLRKNPTGFAQFLDGDIEQVQASTSEDEKQYALAVIARQLTEEYNNFKLQQQVVELQKQAVENSPTLPLPPLTKTVQKETKKARKN